MIVVITGASRGIGKSMAFKFAEAGYELILTAKTNEKLLNTKKEIEAQYSKATIHIATADLSIKKEVEKFASFCISVGVPDILINNAGVYTSDNCIDDKESDIELMMDVNFYSAYYLTRHLVPFMIKKSTGHIFNICSVAALKAYPGGSSYSISKFALNGFSQNLRLELMNHGIKVTAVFPGAALTDTWSNYDNSDKRIMEANDIATMVFSATQLSVQAVVEEIIIRPQLGDL